MVATCPANFDTDRLLQQVRATYDRGARDPQGDFHFHRGPEYACDYLKYDREEIMSQLGISTERFAGAFPEQELYLVAEQEGLGDGRITERFDCFKDTTAEAKVSEDLQVRGVNFFARKVL